MERISRTFYMCTNLPAGKESAVMPKWCPALQNYLIRSHDTKNAGILIDKIMEKLDEIKEEPLYYGGIKIQLTDANRQLFKDALNIAICTLNIETKTQK